MTEIWSKKFSDFFQGDVHYIGTEDGLMLRVTYCDPARQLPNHRPCPLPFIHAAVSVGLGTEGGMKRPPDKDEVGYVLRFLSERYPACEWLVEDMDVIVGISEIQTPGSHPAGCVDSPMR